MDVGMIDGRIVRKVTAFTAERLHDSIMRDMWPGWPTVRQDFGLTDEDSGSPRETQKRFEALYYAIREGEVTIQQLKQVVRNGPALTKLVNRSSSNPHKGIRFTTRYDSGMEKAAGNNLITDVRAAVKRIAKKVTARLSADELYAAMLMDVWPSSDSVLVDFGLTDTDSGSRAETRKRYEALYYPIQEDEITLRQLRKVSGNGPALTKLVNRSPSNPHKGIRFTTSYDDLDL